MTAFGSTLPPPRHGVYIPAVRQQIANSLGPDDAASLAVGECDICIVCPPECGGEPPPPPPPPPDYPDGLYFERMRVWSDGEDWPRGEAELEVHLFGTQKGLYVPFQDPNTGLWILTYQPDLSKLVPFSCAGENASGYRNFNFDGEDGTTFYETVLFAEAEDFAVDEEIYDPAGGLAHRPVSW